MAAPEGASLDTLRAFALELAEVADRIALRHFGGPVPAVAKADGSPVTEADRAIEAALRERVARAWPEHHVLGEEQGGAIDPHAPTWVFDPIDATKNFMRGVPLFATLIALVVGGEPVVGVASAAALGERWDASRGGGARRNGHALRVSRIAALADAQVLYSDADRFADTPGLWDEVGRLYREAWRVRAFGDYYNHLLVAAGSAEAAFERELAPWDVAALACIVEEAGGRVTDFHGRPALLAAAAAPNGVLTSNGLLHDELLARLRRHLP